MCELFRTLGPLRLLCPWLGRLALAILAWPGTPPLLSAQDLATTARPTAPAAVKLDEVDNAALAHLERFQRYLADGQAGEAVEALCNLMDAGGERLIALPGAGSGAGGEYVRFVPLREYCQWRLACLADVAPQALEVYRRRVDPLAEAWLKQALAERDFVRLGQVVERFLVSRSGDDALLRLGELELEQGHFTQARYAWERLSPRLRTPQASSPWLRGVSGSPLGLSFREEDLVAHWDELRPLLTAPVGQPSWLAYPDTELELDDVRARLALVSILEGSTRRAQREWALLRQLNQAAEGTWGGKSGRYVELLTELLAASRTWPTPPAPSDWLTFGGNATRGQAASDGVDVALQPVWSVPLPCRQAGGAPATGLPSSAGTAEESLCYHPLVSASSVLIVTGDTIDDVHGYDLETGRPLWLDTALPPEVVAAQGSNGQRNASGGRGGPPHYTLTADGQRLYVKLGPQATAAPRSDRRDAPPLGYLAALDLQAEKKRLFEIHLNRAPWGDGWAVEGVPLAADGRLYVALRQRDSVRTQTDVAAFDAKRGELVWQRFLAAAESFGQAPSAEYTHNLLSLHEGILYHSTNLGVVAAVRARDGRVQWVTRYPQVTPDAAPDSSSALRAGDPTPCLIHQGLVLAAPADSDRVFALDAATGLLIWETTLPAADDVRHLLGVGGGHLIATGKRLHWIDVETGRISARFPAAVDQALRGYGRGVLAGGQIYWPTRDRIYVFDQQGPRQLRQPIELAPLGLTGGNLLIARDTLLIAAANRLSVFRTSAPPAKPAGQAKPRAPG